MMTPIINNFLSVSHSSLQTTVSHVNDTLVQQLTPFVQQLNPLQQKVAVAAFACLALLSMGLIACRRAWFATKIKALASPQNEKIKTPTPQRKDETCVGSPKVNVATPADKNSEESEHLIEKSEMEPGEDKIVNDQVEELQLPSTPLQARPRETQESVTAVINSKLLPSDGQQKSIFQVFLTPVASLKSMFAELTASPAENYRRTHAQSPEVQQTVESDQAVLEISTAEKHIEDPDTLLRDAEETEQFDEEPKTPMISDSDEQTDDVTKDNNKEELSPEPQDESLQAHSEDSQNPVKTQHESGEKQTDDSSVLPKPEIIADQNEEPPQPEKVTKRLAIPSTPPGKISRKILEKIEKLNLHGFGGSPKKYKEQASHPEKMDEPKLNPAPLRHLGRERATGPQHRRPPSKRPLHIALGMQSGVNTKK